MRKFKEGEMTKMTEVAVPTEVAQSGPGKHVKSRLSLAILCPLLVFLSCCAWPMYRTGSSRLGWSAVDTSSNVGKLQWSFNVNNSFFDVGTPGLVVGYTADQALGGIFVGDIMGHVFSVDTTGTLRWTAAPGEGATPNAVGVDGSVYAVSLDSQFLYALSRDGTTLEWTFSAPTFGPLSGNLAIANDGTAYVGDACGVLYALYPTTGKIKWKFTLFESDCPTTQAFEFSPAIGQDGTIYGAVKGPKLGTGVMFALTPGGSKIWAEGAYWGTPAVAPNGNIYILGSGTTVSSAIYALSSAGKPLWQLNSPLGSEFTLPAIAPDSSFYVNATGLWWVNSSGVPQWQTSLCPSVGGSPPTIGGDGTVYTVSGSTLCAVNPTGPVVKWSATLCSGQFQSTIVGAEPVVGFDGTIYVEPVNVGVDGNGFSLPLCPLQAFH